MSNLIVPYQEKYHDQLVEIWYQAVVHTHKFLTEEDLEFYRQLVQNGALKEVEIWVELAEGMEPIGFTGLDETKIEMLFVDPNFHGKGTGRRLIQHAEKIKGSHLRVDVNEQNDGAYAFYKRLGLSGPGARNWTVRAGHIPCFTWRKSVGREAVFVYRIAICDYEEEQRQQVKRMLFALSVKTGIDFEVALFQAGEQLIEHYEKAGEPFHILILDIEMNGLNGIQTARKLREMKRRSEQIVFLTSYAEYMLESFDVVTFQYLIKPVEPEVFEEKILKLCRYFQELRLRTSRDVRG